MDSDLDHGGPPVEKTFGSSQNGAFCVTHSKIIFPKYAFGLVLLPRITAVIMLNSVAPPSPRSFWGVTIISIPDPYFDHGGTPVEKTFETWQTGVFLVTHSKIIILQYAFGLVLLP